MAPHNAWLLERIPRSFRPAGWEMGSVTSEQVERGFVHHNQSLIYNGLLPNIRPATPEPEDIAEAQSLYQRHNSDYITQWLDNIRTPNSSSIIIFNENYGELSGLASVMTEDLGAGLVDAAEEEEEQEEQDTEDTENSDDSYYDEHIFSSPSTSNSGPHKSLPNSFKETSRKTVSRRVLRSQNQTQTQALQLKSQSKSSLQPGATNRPTMPHRKYPNYHQHRPDSLFHPENYTLPIDPSNMNARESYWRCVICGIDIKRREKVTRHIQHNHGRKPRLS
jgi:hypothetical protein